MDIILEPLAIGHYEEALAPPSEITALLCVAEEIAVHTTRCK
jgi:hypothetical protein